MNNRIETSKILHVPIARAWRAISEPKEVSAWFGATFEEPFVPGQPARGTVTHPGYEGLKFQIEILATTPCELFSFSWHPYAVDPHRDYSAETPTIVEFQLMREGDQTKLTVIETGFEALPTDRAAQAHQGNSEGWLMILEKISKHVGT